MFDISRDLVIESCFENPQPPMNLNNHPELCVGMFARVGYDDSSKNEFGVSIMPTMRTKTLVAAGLLVENLMAFEIESAKISSSFIMRDILLEMAKIKELEVSDEICIHTPDAHLIFDNVTCSKFEMVTRCFIGNNIFCKGEFDIAVHPESSSKIERLFIPDEKLIKRGIGIVNLVIIGKTGKVYKGEELDSILREKFSDTYVACHDTNSENDTFSPMPGMPEHTPAEVETDAQQDQKSDFQNHDTSTVENNEKKEAAGGQSSSPFRNEGSVSDSSTKGKEGKEETNKEE